MLFCCARNDVFFDFSDSLVAARGMGFFGFVYSGFDVFFDANFANFERIGLESLRNFMMKDV